MAVSNDECVSVFRITGSRKDRRLQVIKGRVTYRRVRVKSETNSNLTDKGLFRGGGSRSTRQKLRRGGRVSSVKYKGEETPLVNRLTKSVIEKYRKCPKGRLFRDGD